jgi:hypothetical protein
LFFLPRSARALALSLALGSLTLPISLNAASAGFFDFLFQPQQPAPSNYAPHPHSFRAAHEHEHHRFHHRPTTHFAHVKPERRHEAKQIVLRHPKWDEKDGCCKTREAARPAPILLEDDSLREGDAVMTHSGIKVFTGDAGPHHKINDFALVPDAALSKRARKALLAVDPFRSRPEPVAAETGLATGRSAAEPGVATGSVIVDPKGNRVRYVGP